MIGNKKLEVAMKYFGFQVQCLKSKQFVVLIDNFEDQFRPFQIGSKWTFSDLETC